MAEPIKQADPAALRKPLPPLPTGTGSPDLYIMIRWKGWMITNRGLFKEEGRTCMKGKNARRAWKKILP